MYGEEAGRTTKASLWTINREAAIEHGLHYVEGVRESGLSQSKHRIHCGRNSGYAAIGLAALWGASKVILLGFDMQRTGGASHWHGDHVAPLAQLPSMSRWVDEMVLLGSDLRRAGVRVVNASRQTALKCFVRMPLEEALGCTLPRLHVEGMHGLGDNLHQRAIMRELMKTREVWLETPWPQVYHDLVGPKLHLVSKGSPLRTQAKNAAAFAKHFERLPTIEERLRISYPPASVRTHGSVLAGMCATVGVALGDFRMPVPKAWHAKAEAWVAKWKPARPIMLYRPLVERVEWSGCRNRNPDHETYAALFEAIAPEFFVVSVADLVPKVEWAVGRRVRADVECHAGELDFETLAALAMRSALVFCSPGFLAVLAQSVSTPVINVVGGYEDGTSFAAGGRYAPYLPIEPIRPCPCFSHTHACDKRVDMAKAYAAVGEFAARTLPVPMPFPTAPPVDLKGLPTEFSNPGEIEALIELARSVGARATLEIGCNTGRTSAALLRNVPTLNRAVGVDVLPGYVTDKPAQRREVPARPGHLAAGDPRFELVLRTRGTFDLTPAELGKFDLIFIDGDHGRAGVENDTKLALACVKTGGIIAWHDYNLTGVVDVREVLNEYRAQGRNVRHITGTWLAYEVVTSGIQDDHGTDDRSDFDRRVPFASALGSR